jgi:light-regulated signal transduction histidine kinase (bacteriophytochrome)
VQTIARATVRMSALVRSLLEFSRLGRNKKMTSVDCNTVVKNVVSDQDNLITTTRATILIEDLPTINAYETELMQLFLNLINNAIKFRKKDTPPEIRIGSYNNSNEQLEFFVTDNGMGIESKYFDRIFQIFQRLNIGQEANGDGIGLANCKKIVEMHGGKIWVESDLGKGSTFKFTIETA